MLENSRLTKKVKKELSNGKFWMLGAMDEKGEKITTRKGILTQANISKTSQENIK